MTAASTGFFHACPILIAVRLTNAHLDSKILFDISLFSVVFISNNLTFHHSHILCHKKGALTQLNHVYRLLLHLDLGNLKAKSKPLAF